MSDVDIVGLLTSLGGALRALRAMYRLGKRVTTIWRDQRENMGLRGKLKCNVYIITIEIMPAVYICMCLYFIILIYVI